MALFDLKSLNSALDELQTGARYFARIGHRRVGDRPCSRIPPRIRQARTDNPCDVQSGNRRHGIPPGEDRRRQHLVRQEDEEATSDEDHRSRFNSEQHIMIEDARRIKRDAQLDEEISFPLETREDFGRIAAQAAKQVIMQKVREAERASIIEEYGEREGEIVTGHVQRFERGNLFVDLGRATAILPYDEQIPGERYRQGERVRALLLRVDEGVRGTFIRLSRSHPRFLTKLFETEVPEMANGIVEVKGIVREPGSRAKIAVFSHDEHVDPVGALVGQRGVRVAVVTSELGGEKIDVVEWSEKAG